MAKSFYESKNSKFILRALMDHSSSEFQKWSPGDLRDILEHQLATPISAEMDTIIELSSFSEKHFTSIIKKYNDPTFGDVLKDKSPSPDLLRMLKSYAKASLTEDAGLPKDVARIIYILSIFRGLEVVEKGISSLDKDSMEGERRRCLCFGWLPEDIRDLLRQFFLEV